MRTCREKTSSSDSVLLVRFHAARGAPNAIIFGTHRVQVRDMAWTAIWLNLIGVVVVTVGILLLIIEEVEVNRCIVNSDLLR